MEGPDERCAASPLRQPLGDQQTMVRSFRAVIPPRPVGPASEAIARTIMAFGVSSGYDRRWRSVTMAATLNETIEAAARVLRGQGAREVYLFGSTATGRLRDGSDIDLAIAGLPPERFFRAMGLAADLLDRPLSLVDLDEDTPFTRYLRAEGGLQLVG